MSFLGEWHKQQKALRDAERDRKKNASSILHNYRDGEHAVKEAHERKAWKDAERNKKSTASELLHNYRSSDQDVHVYKSIAKMELTRSSADQYVNDRIPDSSTELKRDSANLHPGKSRQLFNVDFSFGVILKNSEPTPDLEFCAQAASAIIPHVLSQWSTETKLFCDSKTPKITNDVTTDDWYDSDDSIRYVIKGKVPVHLFVENSEKDTVTPLQKALKRHVSFKPISEKEAKNATKERKAQFIIADIGDGKKQKWIRVREGRLSGLGITF